MYQASMMLCLELKSKLTDDEFKRLTKSWITFRGML